LLWEPSVGNGNAIAIAVGEDESQPGKGKQGGSKMGSDVAPIRGSQSDVSEDCISERRLWTAVVACALEDWRGGTLRQRREAQQFIFENHADFENACSLAGLDRESLRSRLLKIGHMVAMEGAWEN
jgi:hypothetical protein